MSSQIAGAVERALQLPGDPPVTVVFANAPYQAIVANWIVHARAAGASNILLMALDEQTVAFAEQMQLACAPLPSISSRQELWFQRIEVFSALANAGVSFIHSDADAVWLRSPYEAVLTAGVDLSFSQGTRWPNDIVDLWGFVLCCGFFAVRANAATARFFEAVQRRMADDADDQTAVNRALRDAGIVWEPDNGEPREWHGRPFEIFPRHRIGRTADVAVALLAYRQFARLPEVPAEAVVCHPVGKDPMVDRLRRLGLWRMG
jgi:hypothetical protein